MRRKDREVTDPAAIREIAGQCRVCHVAMIDGDMPYVLPLSFGYEIKEEQLVLYFHSAAEGRKVDILHRNNRVCFELCREGEILYNREAPCESGCLFSCLHGFGRAEFLEDPEEKCRALTLIMKRQTGHAVLFTREQAARVCVFKIVSDTYTAKKRAGAAG